MTTFGTSSDTSNTTNSHDPLCPFAPCECYKDGSGIHSCGTDTCQCDLIAKVRADERQAEANRRTQQFGYWHDYHPGFP